MSRRHRRRPPPAAGAPGGRPSGGLGPEQVEEHPDGAWVVRRVSGSAATKAYRCPGCDHEIRPATPHVVAWPAVDPGGLDQRRHWHTGCWTARPRRLRGPGLA